MIPLWDVNTEKALSKLNILILLWILDKVLMVLIFWLMN
jgi:hypothetical protein